MPSEFLFWTLPSGVQKGWAKYLEVVSSSYYVTYNSFSVFPRFILWVFIAFLIFGELPIKNRCIFKPQKLSRIGLVHVFISNNNSQNNFLSFKDSQFISCHSCTLSKNKHSLKKALIFKRKIVLPKVLLLPTLFSPKIDPESLKWTVLFFCERKWAQQQRS